MVHLYLAAVFLVSVFALATAESEVRQLFWVPNNAGLFSHFLQLKIVHKLASELERTLVVAPTQSPHYGNLTIDMCAIFDFPRSVSCAAIPEEVPCSKNAKDLTKKKGKPDVCYSGTISFGAQVRGRHFIIRAVDLPVRLQFSPAHRALADRFFNALVQHVGQRNEPFALTVVHWRRGDQLQGRCGNKIDASVNCADGAALVQKVQARSQADEVVYIATNEPQDSAEMVYLRSKGFVTLSDVVASGGDASLSRMDAFQVLAAEVSLMLRADTFLGWGISEINDVVEFERRQEGRTHCVAEWEDGPVLEEARQTWCSLLRQREAQNNGTRTR
jgi:hypothetical protein